MADVEVVTLDKYTQEFDQNIQDGIASGDLVLESTDVSAKNSEGTKVGKMTYDKVVAKTENGALILAGGSWDKLKEMVTAQADAATRANVRNAILRDIEGPEKELRKIATRISKKYGKDENEVFAALQANPALAELMS